MIGRLSQNFFFILLIWILWVFPNRSNAQSITKFSRDSTKFIGELQSVYENLSDVDQKTTKSLMEHFALKWNNEQFNPSKKQIIYNICDKMLKKRFRPFPDFYNYINSLDVFMDTHQPDYLFYEWSGVLQKLINGKNIRVFLAFLDGSIPLFSENLIYKSISTRWKITNPDYHYFMDSVPFITFAKSDLIGYTSKDSLTIFGTKGRYYPLANRWVGEGGRVDWRRAGLDPQEAFADLHSYQISTRFSRIEADSADLTYKKYFTSPLKGKFNDKAQADLSEERTNYPAFDSYDKQISIPEIFKDIDYFGGFALEGARILGKGNASNKAHLSFKKDHEELIRVNSMIFDFHSNKINSISSAVIIRYKDDSVFHPGLQMKYIDEKRELTLSKDEEMRIFSPWFDSFHKIEIYCEELTWNVGQSVMDFGMSKGPSQEQKTVFESSNFFAISRYEKLRGIDEQNPLALLKAYSDKTKKKEVKLEELCIYLQRPPEQVEAQLLNLSSRGFLIYDLDKRVARLNDKITDYVNASNYKTDYDVIFFNSSVARKSNAILTLDSFDLRIQGIVPYILLSDSQNVIIYPTKQEIILQKNRNFHFSGKIRAGLFELYARNCYFEYGTFKLDLPIIDSMSFYVKSRYIDPKTGLYGLVKVKTNINDLNGELLIDHPHNKAGLRYYPQYPVLISKNDALVNWDKKSIQNGAYKKESFFYKVYPFTFRSLNKFPTDSLQFKGYLSSAGIFPDLEQPLKVRPDYSLGIENTTDAAGLPLYGGKGRFINRIDMSNEGLHGNGKMEYLNSSSVSENFAFYPDSMKSLARKFDATELIANEGCPAVHGDSVSEFWLPYKDSLIVSTTKLNFKKDMTMYNGQSRFAGNLTLSPNGMTGAGTVKIKEAEMDSRRFLFKQKTFDANIADFRIKSTDVTFNSIATKNYQTHFDFTNRIGAFKSNVGISKVEFPLNEYKCTMDRFDWMIDKDEIVLYNEKNTQLAAIDTMRLSKLIDYDFSGSEFVSTHPLQDSLRFHSMKAIYNLKTNVINAEEVRLIKVADAGIFPDSGKVCILKGAVMKPLSRAVIIANQKDKYHQFYNANVTISSRKKYLASGNYDYVNKNEERQAIHFSKIAIDSSGETYADGMITDSLKFKLSPEFEYAGEVILHASQKNLTFYGGFRPLSECVKNATWWVKFKGVIDPKDVQLPVNRPLRDIRNEKLFLGIAYNNSENRIYSGFFIKKENSSDSILMSADGFISYNDNKNLFNIATPDQMKVAGEVYNSMALYNEQCIVHADGTVNFNLKSGAMKMEAYGGMSHYLIPDSTGSRVAIAFNFPFSESGREKFSQQLVSTNLSGITFNETPYYLAMKTLMGQKEFDKQKSDMELVGKFKIPDEINRTMFLADVRLSWDPATQAWVSYGPIGIGNIGKTKIYKYVTGKIELAKKKNGDDITIYLELTRADWYYFNYRNNVLQVISSNLEFNDQISNEERSSSEQKRVKQEAKDFHYMLSNDRKRRDFLRKFQAEE